MNTSLPIFNYRQEIIEAIKYNDVVIIEAETGTGKSTQVPQYLHKAGYDVVITEPKRISACLLAERVAEEMKIPLGILVGYKTAYEKNISEDTTILYCTDGFELVITLPDRVNNLEKVLIIDEVHEWSKNIDILIAWIKRKIKEGWNKKVIIMSATHEENLKEYFEDVAKVYTLNILGKLHYVDFEQRGKDNVIKSICEMNQDGRDTLVFVSGKKQVLAVINKLSKFNLNAKIFPLYKELSLNEQRKCFYETYGGKPKIIVTTNIIQTSIAVPNITAVIDTGEENIIEERNGIRGLYKKVISKKDIEQRKSQAGKIREGKYILCSDISYSMREESRVPEIQRISLETTILNLLTNGIDIETFELFHKPSIKEIYRAKENLRILGAIKENSVTSIGYKMAKIPGSVECARMIVEAEKYNVVKEVICIAAIIEFGGLLSKGTSYKAFTAERESDILAELDIWTKLQKMRDIDIKEMGINLVTYNKIAEHINKIHNVLTGVMNITSSIKDRDNIKKSCLSGMINNIYVREYGNSYKSSDCNTRNLNYKCCFYNKKEMLPDIVIGIPKDLPITNRFGVRYTKNFISFATKITAKELLEIAPQFVTKKVGKVSYLKNCVITHYCVYFKDEFVGVFREKDIITQTEEC